MSVRLKVAVLFLITIQLRTGECGGFFFFLITSKEFASVFSAC